MVTITFPDGSTKEYDAGATALDIAKDISEGLARNVLAAKINGHVVDAFKPITEDAELQLLTSKDPEGLEVLRHSAAHLLAHAVRRLYPDSRETIGPVIENGFYYDFDKLKITEEDLGKIEAEMKKIIKEKIPVSRLDHPSKADAIKTYKDNKYKVELINEFEESSSTYVQGDFQDLCRGPHVPNTGLFKQAGIKLDKIAGAYWRGNSENQMLTRIYGLCFADKKALNEYLEMRAEAEKRDHRKIGKDLDLYSISEYAPGMPFFHNKGMIIWNELENYWREVHKKDGYELIKTPIMLDKSLWEISGHWFNYKEHMYTSKIDNREYAIKPMNCPGGILVYKSTSHSYKDLPIKMGEIGLVHRNELSGALSGLFRVRCFHQDDAHIFMREDQIKDQILGVLKLTDEVYGTLGLDYHLELSTRPEKSIGSDEAWEAATNGLQSALEASGKEYKMNPGDGAFYGPKIDIHLRDAIGRTHQCGTIQLDMSLPERFDIHYVDEHNNKVRPVMIHRVIYGSFERFFGILVEHFAGKFPLWLAPTQVKLLPIADRHADYAHEVAQQMSDAGLRAEVDTRAETVNKKVREAQLAKVNYILVVGDKEMEEGTVTVRTRDEKVHGAKKVPAVIKDLAVEVKERKLPDY